MIGYDAMWGAKCGDALAAYQKPGRVMFLRQTRIGGLFDIDLAAFYNGENQPYN